jgi:hypothetical protein
MARLYCSGQLDFAMISIHSSQNLSQNDSTSSLITEDEKTAAAAGVLVSVLLTSSYFLYLDDGGGTLPFPFVFVFAFVFSNMCDSTKVGMHAAFHDFIIKVAYSMLSVAVVLLLFSFL